MKNTININTERVEVMALFGYEMTPCQPLNFKKQNGEEFEVSELRKTHIRFVGSTAIHIFDVIAGQNNYQLSFNATNLSWHLRLA
mgnify:FL=1